MTYKLQKYEEDVCSMLMSIYASPYDFAGALGYYKDWTRHFNTSERALTLCIWMELIPICGVRLANSIGTEFPNCTGKDIETLMCHAIKKTFGYTVKQLIALDAWNDEF